MPHVTIAPETVTASAVRYQAGLDAVAADPDMATFAGCRVGVVGCSGLIGGALTAILLRANALQGFAEPIRVVGLARRSDDTLPPRDIAFQFVQGSVGDTDILERWPACDYIIYLAGPVSDYLNRRNESVETQIIGLERFLMQAEGCRHFTYISSTRVYGRQTGEEPIKEAQPVTHLPMHLDNIYNSCKHYGESLCLWHAQNRRIARLRGASRQYLWPAARAPLQSALTDFVQQAATTQRIVLKGHPDSVRNQCCVLDIAQGLLKMLMRGTSGDAYNIGSREHISSQAMARQVGAVFPFSVEVTGPTTAVERSVQRVSVEKAATQLGYTPAFTFAEVAPLVVARIVEGLNAT